MSLGVAGCTPGVRAPATTAPSPAASVAVPVASPAAVVAPTRPVVAASLQGFVDSLVNLPVFASAHWGVLILAPEHGDTLASVQADRLVMPASNMKLVTGAVALAQLGADFTWSTTFTRTGPITTGVLRGDIIVSGNGDPSVSTAMRTDPLTAFDPLVAALKVAGVTRVAGMVRADSVRAFPGSPLGFGWDWDDLDAPYGAGVAELLFNEGFTDVTVRGCRTARRTACAESAPLTTAPLVRQRVTVRAANSGPPDLEWWRDSAAVPGITIRGSIAEGDSSTFSVALPDNRLTYVAAVTRALTRAGITVSGREVRSASSAPIVTLQSPPLRDVLGVMQKPSQNQIAEVLYRTLGLVRAGAGTPDSGRAVVERQLAEWGVRTDARAIRDGSGLSRHDYLTPRAIIQVLEAMRRAPTFRLFHEALPAAGAEGTLRNRMRSFADGRVRAKTGTIDKARALSGYVTTLDGEIMLFSIIANNHVAPNREVDRVAELIVEQLVNHRRATP